MSSTPQAPSALAAIRTRIAAIRPNATLLAVSKGQPFQKIQDLYAQGQRDFAENYVQELVEKAKEAQSLGIWGAEDPIRWHLIGHLQSNKIAAVLPWVASIHSVDSVKLAQKIAHKLRAMAPPRRLAVFLEVNIDAQQSKSGFLPEVLREAIPALEALTDVLDYRGLMAIPMPEEEGGVPAAAFGVLCELESQCRPLTRGELSMGMSQDFEAALRAGATHVRVGTALFGARAGRTPVLP